MLALAFKMDERVKKVLLVLVALFIIILLIFGAIYFFIKKYMEHEAKELDDYMYDLCNYRIVKDEKEFKKAVNYYETRSLFNNSKWALRIMIVLSIVLILLGNFVFNHQIKEMFIKAFELIPTLKYETVGSINDILKESGTGTKINMPRWMPASIFPSIISKNPNLKDPIIWISTVYYVIAIICFFKLLGAILGYISRKNRTKKMAKEVFRKKLENLNVATEENNLEDLSNSPL